MNKNSFLARFFSVYISFFMIFWCKPVLALPQGPSVIQGGASISNPSAGILQVNQATQKAIINWNSFSIGNQELTQFIQPGSSASVLNRVTGGNLSQIYGTLKANGNVYLVNPNGILIGSSGLIDVNTFVASTLDVNNGAFMAGGDMIFSGSSDASIENLGTINAVGGDIFLIARNIKNSGSINAPKGTVGLAAGKPAKGEKLEVLLKASGSQRIFIRTKKIKEPEESQSTEIEEESDTNSSEGGSDTELSDTDLDITESEDAPLPDDGASETIDETNETTTPEVDETSSPEVEDAPSIDDTSTVDSDIQGEGDSEQTTSKEGENVGTLSISKEEFTVVEPEYEYVWEPVSQKYNVGQINSDNVLAVGDDFVETEQEAASESVKVQDITTGILNSGVITAVQAELKAVGGNEYALAINNSGEIRATAVETHSDGSVSLVAEGGVIENTGSIIADDRISVESADFTNTGSLVSKGGTVDIDVQNSATIGGLIDVSDSSGDGGQITVKSNDVLQTLQDAVLTASGGDLGGQVNLLSQNQSNLSGLINATGSQGGGIIVEADQINLSGANLSAIGNQGGDIFVGGDRLGELKLSSVVNIDSASIIDATGDNGHIEIWSNEKTQFLGSAKTGTDNAGGFLEVSSKGLLDYRGKVTAGQGGTVLFDPKNIIITAEAPGILGDLLFGDDSGVTSYIDSYSVESILDGGSDLLLQASNDITLEESLIYGSESSGDLSLEAGRSIFINGDITSNGGGLSLTANADASAGVIDADREMGDATIQIDGILDLDYGGLTIKMDDGEGKTYNGAGDIVLGEVMSAGVVNINSLATNALVTNNPEVTILAESITINSESSVQLSSITLDTTSYIGDININGNLNGNGIGSFDGVSMDDTLIDSGGGYINISGVGGNNEGENYGVYMVNTLINSDFGEIQIDGTGGSGSAEGIFENHGIVLGSGVTISSDDAGIVLVGNGGESDGHGILVKSASITTNSGSISLNGTSSISSGNGVLMQGADITSTSGSIQIQGQGAGADSDIHSGPLPSGIGSTIGDGTTGDIKLISSSLNLSSMTISTSGDFIAQASEAAHNLVINSDLGATLSAGMNSVTIGRADGTGNVVIDHDNNFNQDVTIQAATGLIEIGATIDVGTSDLTLSTSGDVSDSNEIGSVYGNQLNINAKSVSLTNESNSFTGVSINTTAHADLVFNGGITFGASNIGGNLNVTTKALTDQSASMQVGGTAYFNTTFSDLILNFDDNVFGTLSLDAANVVINEEDNIDFGDVNVSTLDVSSNDYDISNSGTMTISGNSLLDAGSGNISLNNGSDTYGGSIQVVSANNVTLYQSTGDLVLAGIDATGNLTAISQLGNVLQSAETSILVDGNSLLNAYNGNIVLTENGNDFNSVTTLDAVNFSITDINDIQFHQEITLSGSINVHAGGNIFGDNAAITQSDSSDDAKFTSEIGGIFLGNANNDFHSLELNGNSESISVKDVNGLLVSNISNVTGGDVTITAFDDLIIGNSIYGVDVLQLNSTNGDISTASIELGNSISRLGSVEMKAGENLSVHNVYTDENQVFESGVSEISSAVGYGQTDLQSTYSSTGGSIIFKSSVSLMDEQVDIEAGDSVQINGDVDGEYALNIIASNNISISGDTYTQNSITITSTNAGDITLGSVYLGGNMTLDSGGGNITINGTVDGNHVVDIDTTDLERTTDGSFIITGDMGATEELNSITISAGSGGITLHDVTTYAGQAFAANNISLNSTYTSTGGSSLLFTGKTDLSSGDVFLNTNGGNISFTGGALTNSGKGSIDLNSVSGIVSLGQVDSSFSGNVSLTALSATINADGDLNLGDVSTSESLTISSGGTVTTYGNFDVTGYSGPETVPGTPSIPPTRDPEVKITPTNDPLPDPIVNPPIIDPLLIEDLNSDELNPPDNDPLINESNIEDRENDGLGDEDSDLVGEEGSDTDNEENDRSQDGSEDDESEKNEEDESSENKDDVPEVLDDKPKDGTDTSFDDAVITPGETYNTDGQSTLPPSLVTSTSPSVRGGLGDTNTATENTSPPAHTPPPPAVPPAPPALDNLRINPGQTLNLGGGLPPTPQIQIKLDSSVSSDVANSLSSLPGF